MSECWFESQLLCFQSSFLLIYLLGSGWSPCYPRGRPGRSFWLLPSVWPNPNCGSHRRKEPVTGLRSLPLALTLSLSSSFSLPVSVLKFLLLKNENTNLCDSVKPIQYLTSLSLCFLITTVIFLCPLGRIKIMSIKYLAQNNHSVNNNFIIIAT